MGAIAASQCSKGRCRLQLPAVLRDQAHLSSIRRAGQPCAHLRVHDAVLQHGCAGQGMGHLLLGHEQADAQRHQLAAPGRHQLKDSRHVDDAQGCEPPQRSAHLRSHAESELDTASGIKLRDSSLSGLIVLS